MRPLTLRQALVVIVEDSGTPIARAARRLDGIPAFGAFASNDGGLLGQAYHDILEDLPARHHRAFTISEFVDATHERREMDNAADVWKARSL